MPLLYTASTLIALLLSMDHLRTVSGSLSAKALAVTHVPELDISHLAVNLHDELPIAIGVMY